MVLKPARLGMMKSSFNLSPRVMTAFPGSEDAGIEVISHFALVVPVEFLSQKRGDVLGFQRVDGTSDKRFVQQFEVRLFLEDDVGGIFCLHDTPVIGETVVLDDRTIPLS